VYLVSVILSFVDITSTPQFVPFLTCVVRNPVIGYCQSMNIIAATLLLFLEEEDAFYLFVSIIEKIPEYYEKSLLGM
jgi:hypothetical protein